MPQKSFYSNLKMIAPFMPETIAGDPSARSRLHFDGRAMARARHTFRVSVGTMARLMAQLNSRAGNNAAHSASDEELWRETHREMTAAAQRIKSPELRVRARRLVFPHLHNACIRGDVELVKALLDEGLAPDMYPRATKEDNEPPLVWVAQARLARRASPDQLLAVAALLLARGAGVDKGTVAPLRYALDGKDIEMIELLLGSGADSSQAKREH